MEGSALSRRSLLQLGAMAAMSSTRSGKASRLPAPGNQESGSPGNTTGSKEPLQTRGLFTHAWDLKDEGPPSSWGGCRILD